MRRKQTLPIWTIGDFRKSIEGIPDDTQFVVLINTDKPVSTVMIPVDVVRWEEGTNIVCRTLSEAKDAESECTRQTLVNSKRWIKTTEELDISALCEAGILSVEALTPKEHEEVRIWAEKPEIFDTKMPSVLSEYIEKVKAYKRENEE